MKIWMVINWQDLYGKLILGFKQEVAETRIFHLCISLVPIKILLVSAHLRKLKTMFNFQSRNALSLVKRTGPF